MSDTDKKLLGLGEMVFGLITDVLVSCVGSGHTDAYVRRTITTPDGFGGKHKVEIIVVKNAAMADLFEEAVAKTMPVDLMAAGSSAKQ